MPRKSDKLDASGHLGVRRKCFIRERLSRGDYFASEHEMRCIAGARAIFDANYEIYVCRNKGIAEIFHSEHGPSCKLMRFVRDRLAFSATLQRRRCVCITRSVL